MLQEFKDFIAKGGVLEAAIGLIMALAFKPIVDSLVADVILPVVGRIFGTPDFSSLKINLGGKKVPDPLNPDGDPIEAAIRYGQFLDTIISFVIIAAVLFLMIKAYNKSTGVDLAEDGPSDNDLLVEIRDSLKTR